MYKDKKITLDDGKAYLVIEEVEQDGRIYLCLVNSQNEEDMNFVEIKDNKAVDIESDFFNKNILPLFMDKFKK